MAGLRDQPRPGKKPRYGEELRRRLLRQLELPPPPGWPARRQPPEARDPSFLAAKVLAGPGD